MEYGIEVKDASGNVILDNDMLTYRLWYSGEFTGPATVTFSEPLNHTPDIVVLGVSAYIATGTESGRYAYVEIRLIRSGGIVTGLRILKGDMYIDTEGFTLSFVVLVFAKE